MTIDSLEVILYTCVFLLPGYLIKALIDRICLGHDKSDSKYFFSCLFYSAINFLFLGQTYIRFFQQQQRTEWTNFSSQIWGIVAISIVSILGIGLISGFIQRTDIFSIILSKLTKGKFKTISSVPAAWEYAFSKGKSYFVIVTLKDNSIIYGDFSENSFASSEGGERDLFLEKTFSLQPNGEWKLNEDNAGILITKDQITTIEFKEGR